MWPGSCTACTFQSGLSPDLQGPTANQSRSTSLRQTAACQGQTGTATSHVLQLGTGGQTGRLQVEVEGRWVEVQRATLPLVDQPQLGGGEASGRKGQVQPHAEPLGEKAITSE